MNKLPLDVKTPEALSLINCYEPWLESLMNRYYLVQSSMRLRKLEEIVLANDQKIEKLNETVLEIEKQQALLFPLPTNYYINWCSRKVHR